MKEASILASELKTKADGRNMKALWGPREVTLLPPHLRLESFPWDHSHTEPPSDEWKPGAVHSACSALRRDSTDEKRE